MAAITTRETAGTGATINPTGPLSNAQLDTNFINLNNDIASRLPLAGGTMTGLITTRGTTGVINVGNQGAPGIEVYADIAAGASQGNAAYMTFHRPGAYAVRFGLDTDNILKVGGWSLGAASHTIWHSGNITPLTAESDTLATVTGRGNVATLHLIVPAGEGTGYGFWGANDTYGIAMGVTAATYQYGPVTDYSIKTYMSADVGRGFTWGVKGSKPVAGLEVTTGNMTIAGAFSAKSKSFLIDHPTKPGKKLRYGSLEGPENGIYVRGKLNGNNKIELPEYWTKLVDPDSITVNLTPIGRHQDLYVDEVTDNVVVIKNSNFVNKEINCYYTVFAERVDVEDLEVEIG